MYVQHYSPTNTIRRYNVIIMIILLYIVICCFVPISTARYLTLVTSLFLCNIIFFPPIVCVAASYVPWKNTQHVFSSFLSDYCRVTSRCFTRNNMWNKVIRWHPHVVVFIRPKTYTILFSDNLIRVLCKTSIKKNAPIIIYIYICITMRK